MITIETILDLREQVAEWRARGDKIALVPTMGNLHEGHLSLVRRALTLANRVIVSIFVNPLQFGEGEDYESYPNTLTEDADKLISVDADLLFMPPVSEVYRKPQAELTRVEVPGISDIFCGESRQGHFVGVATVVCKLFNIVQPDLTLFGEKDFQQLIVIRRMTEDLFMPVEIIGVPTVREVDGLARSSRNGYLTERERSIAPILYKTLNEIGDALRRGAGDFDQMEKMANSHLAAAGFIPDYFHILSAEDLSEPDESCKSLVILAAVYLGKARLIDNIQLSLGGSLFYRG